MPEKIMTKDTEKLLCLIYKLYLENKKSSQSKYQAIAFDHYNGLPAEFRQHVDEDEFLYGINELSTIGFIKKYVDGGFLLKPEGIIFMESRFGKSVSEVIDILSKFVP